MPNSSSSSLPPAKRFKLLGPDDSPPPATDDLPRVLRTPPRCCLPAKKRVLAPPRPAALIDLNLPQPPDEDDGVFCSVCRGADGDPADPIVFCDGCDLAVHASCYGNPLIRSVPEGDWFCERCREAAPAAPRCCCCCLCPARGGAMKKTTGGRWAHVACALFVPEVFFADPVGRDGVDLSRVPVRRWGLRCFLCGSVEGCAVECSEPRCGLAFHVTCGLETGLCLEYREGKAGAIVVGFCADHTRLWDKQQSGKFTFVPREHKKRKHQ